MAFERELFRNENLAVRHVGGFGPDCCVVTFDSFTDERTLDRPGFGQGFFQSRGIDAIHVISRENDWYQYVEMADAMAAVRGTGADYRRVVTYGSSMGAYAAIRLAGLAGAHCAMSLSPQFSIDPAVVPFEYRWEEPSRRFRPVWERDLPFPMLEQAYVAYDPEDLDRKHLALLAARFRFTPVRLPGAGHPVTGFLAELRLLEELVLQACRGGVDVAGFTAKARQRRAQSPQYFAVRAARARRMSTKVAELQRAVALDPRNAPMQCLLGVQLGKAGRFAEAEAAHQASLAILPGHPNLLLHHSYTAELGGDVARAVALMEEALAVSGGASLYQSRAAWLRARLAGKKVPMPSWWRRSWARLRRRGDGRSIAAGR